MRGRPGLACSGRGKAYRCGLPTCSAEALRWRTTASGRPSSVVGWRAAVSALGPASSLGCRGTDTVPAGASGLGRSRSSRTGCTSPAAGCHTACCTCLPRGVWLEARTCHPYGACSSENSQRQITLMCFYGYNHVLKLGKIVITWWNVHFKMNMGSSYVHGLTIYVRYSVLHKPLHVLFLCTSKLTWEKNKFPLLVFSGQIWESRAWVKKSASSPGILPADLGEQGVGEKTSLLSWYPPGGFGRAGRG